MGQQDQLREEQAAVDVHYSRLDELRAQIASRLRRIRRSGPSGSPQNRSERDAFATLYEDRLAQLNAVEQRLTFGRLDLADGTIRYIGRIGLTDSDHTPLLTDWRAPAAQAFYRATPTQPEAIVRRRHLVTQGRKVTSIEDEVLDLKALHPDHTSLSGEGALLASLAAARTGRMSDIVATIQAEQDAVIRSELSGALVVQGGPGTGKTAVALHRAAYLLYAHRRSLERSGVLLVGPSRTFLHYIDQVLPSLGETGVVTTTIGDLFPTIRAEGVEADEVAEVKGRPEMAAILARAVRQRQRVPDGVRELAVDGRALRLDPRDFAAAITRARRSGRPHNLARSVFVREMLERLAAQYVEQLGFAVSPEDRASVIEELRTTRGVRIALNLAWMPLTPQRLVGDLFAKTHLLEAAAPELTPSHRAALIRAPGAAWTAADVPLLDEAAELLGEDDQAERAQAAEDVRRRAADIEYARQVLSTSDAGGLVSAELLADRFAGSGPSLTTAERAAADRTWTYGHIVVDEAQELSAMAWRMLLRRCPTRSMTIVGDLAQASTATRARTWSEVLEPALKGSWRLVKLTVNYRTPAEVARAAQRFAEATDLPTSALTSAREVPDALSVHRAKPSELFDTVVSQAEGALARLGSTPSTPTGRVAVIAPDDLVAETSRALSASSLTPYLRARELLDAPLAVLTARAAKGLEFDVVVLVEPAAMASRSPGDLYVAMTRPTQALRVVSSGDLPPGLNVRS